MNEIKRTLGRMAIYYLFLVIEMILSIGVIVDNFPTRNLTTLFLSLLAIFLILYYSHRVPPENDISILMKLLSWMAFILMLFRGIKYSAVSQIDILARYCWYLYYVPILLIPLFLFYISLLVARKRSGHISKLWYLFLVFTIILIILILTNDFHQQAFIFQKNFENWNDNYSYGWLFYLVNVWQFGLFLAAIIVLTAKCRINSSKKHVWFIVIPVSFGILMYVLLLTGNVPKINGSTLIEFPEAHLFTIAVVLECCMELGLIPTNNEYGKVFKNLSINTQITDEDGKTIYASSSAVSLSKEQFELPSGSRIDEHNVLYKMKLPGGYGFWQNDMSELDRINDELLEVKEGLEQEAEITRLNNEFLEKEIKIKERTLLYDLIAKSTVKQSKIISLLAKEARESNDLKIKDEHRRHIALLGAYIKRYANLTILSQENKNIEVGELGLSIAEMLNYLNICGIPGEFVNDSNSLIEAPVVLAIFEVFGNIIEDNYSSLKGVFVNLSVKENIYMKVMIENMKTPICKEVLDDLLKIEVTTNVEVEDNISYITFIIKKGEK